MNHKLNPDERNFEKKAHAKHLHRRMNSFNKPSTVSLFLGEPYRQIKRAPFHGIVHNSQSTQWEATTLATVADNSRQKRTGLTTYSCDKCERTKGRKKENDGTAERPKIEI